MREIKIHIFVLTVGFLISLGAAIHYRSELANCKDSRDEAATEIAAAIREARGPIAIQITKVKSLIREQADIRKELCTHLAVATRAATPGCE